MSSLLPELLSFGGDWHAYVNALYAAFTRDFITTQPIFRGLPVRLRHEPYIDNRSRAFRHITTEGPVEDENRLPDLRRCERICWPRAIIDLAGRGSPAIRIWRDERSTSHGRVTSTNLALDDFSYLVVLGEKRSAYLLVTAFPVEQDHTRRKHRRAWQSAQ